MTDEEVKKELQSTNCHVNQATGKAENKKTYQIITKVA